MGTRQPASDTRRQCEEETMDCVVLAEGVDGPVEAMTARESDCS